MTYPNRKVYLLFCIVMKWSSFVSFIIFNFKNKFNSISSWQEFLNGKVFFLEDIHRVENVISIKMRETLQASVIKKKRFTALVFLIFRCLCVVYVCKYCAQHLDMTSICVTILDNCILNKFFFVWFSFLFLFLFDFQSVYDFFFVSIAFFFYF